LNAPIILKSCDPIADSSRHLIRDSPRQSSSVDALLVKFTDLCRDLLAIPSLLRHRLGVCDTRPLPLEDLVTTLLASSKIVLRHECCLQQVSQRRGLVQTSINTRQLGIGVPRLDCSMLAPTFYVLLGASSVCRRPRTGPLERLICSLRTKFPQGNSNAAKWTVSRSLITPTLKFY
jgi:hypothetical protein